MSFRFKEFSFAIFKHVIRWILNTVPVKVIFKNVIKNYCSADERWRLNFRFRLAFQATF